MEQSNKDALNDADVRDYFKRTAASFDHLYSDEQQARSLFDQLFRKPMYWRFELTFDALQEGAGKRYLDVGCGSGRQATLLAETGAHVTGIDFSDEMLNLARSYAESKNVSERTDFKLAHFLHWVKDYKEHFDAVYALGVFDYTDDPLTMMSEMARVSDLVIASWPAPNFPRAQLRTWRYKRMGCPVYFYTGEKVRSLHAEAGLELMRMHACGKAGFWTLARKGQAGS